MPQILVVEDDKELNRSVYALLNQIEYEAAGCLSAIDTYGPLPPPVGPHHKYLEVESDGESVDLPEKNGL